MGDKKPTNSLVKDDEEVFPVDKNNPINDIKIKFEEKADIVLSVGENDNSDNKNPLYNIEASKKLLNILMSKDISWNYTGNDMDVLNKVLLKIEELVKEGADPNIKDEKGMNALQKTLHSTHYGIWETDFRMEQLIKLIRLGVEIDCFSFVQFIKIQKYEFCQELVKKGFRPDPKSEQDWRSWMGTDFAWLKGVQKKNIEVRKQFINIFKDAGIPLTELTVYYMNSLIVMAKDGNIEGVKVLFSTLGDSVNYKCGEDTALSACCGDAFGGGNIEILELLIQEGAKDPEGIALTRAAENPDIRFFSTLLQSKIIAPEIIKSLNFAILAGIIHGGNINSLKFALENGFNIYTKDEKGNSLIDHCFLVGGGWKKVEYEMFEFVIEEFVKSKGSKNDLEESIKSFLDNEDVFTKEGVKIIMKFKNIGVDFNLNDKNFFFHGCRIKSNKFQEFVDALKNFGAIDILYTPNGLLLACAHEDQQLIQHLVEIGKVDINCIGSFDDTPLITVSKHNNTTKTAALLITLGASHINIMGDGNFTPLLSAANEGNITMVKFLLDNGAEVINDGQRIIRRLSDFDIHNTDQGTANEIISLIKDYIKKAKLRDLGI